MTHYRFVEFWSQKAWVFLRKSLSFSQETWVLTFFQFLGGKFVQNIPNMDFFGALRANIRDFKIHDGNFTTGSLSFLGQIGNSYRFVKFWSKKGLEFLYLLSFFSLSFRKSGQKKPEYKSTELRQKVKLKNCPLKSFWRIELVLYL